MSSPKLVATRRGKPPAPAESQPANALEGVKHVATQARCDKMRKTACARGVKLRIYEDGDGQGVKSLYILT